MGRENDVFEQVERLRNFRAPPVEPTRGGTFLFLFVGLVALAFPIAGGTMAYRRFDGDRYLREHGVRVQGTVVGHSVRYRLTPAKGSSHEISKSDYEAYATGRSSMSQGSSVSATYELSYDFPGPGGVTHHGAVRHGAPSTQNRYPIGSSVEVVYAPGDPSNNSTAFNVADTAGSRAFWSIAVVFFAAASLPGLFFLYSAWVNERMRRRRPPPLRRAA